MALDAVPSPVMEVIWADVGLVDIVNVTPSLMVRVFGALITNSFVAIVLLETVVFVVTGFAIAKATTWEPTRILPLVTVLIAVPPGS